MISILDDMTKKEQKEYFKTDKELKINRKIFDMV